MKWDMVKSWNVCGQYGVEVREGIVGWSRFMRVVRIKLVVAAYVAATPDWDKTTAWGADPTRVGGKE